VFELLRRGHQVKPQAHLIAFDPLEIDGRELAGKAIELRKAELAQLLRDAGPGLQLCEFID
jgi:ATP-dependent DNA ligase